MVGEFLDLDRLMIRTFDGGANHPVTIVQAIFPAGIIAKAIAFAQSPGIASLIMFIDIFFALTATQL